MKVIELFCGTKSFAKVAKARGHETFTVDNDRRFEPDLVADINQIWVEDFPVPFRTPDIVWASPPCQKFSVMTIGRNWDIDARGFFHPRNPEVKAMMELADHTVKLIMALRPKFYFIENPRAVLRKMPFMKGLPRSTVTYCQYGEDYMKPTDIWNNCYTWKPRMCNYGDPCHKNVPRGTHGGIQGLGRSSSWQDRARRATVPARLCEEILIACEGGE